MQIIQSDDAPKAIGPYSQAIVSGGFLFASGQIPLTLEGVIIEGGVEAQTEQVFKNVRAVLAAAGATLDNVVKATVFVQDLKDFAAINAIYEKHFGAHKPARSTIQVAGLPRGAMVEIEVVARIG